ncbi:hypothetical protein [Streptomyces sp. XH2]|uniref:hypothetical protein n=1 Tax=Streptomyces sp. XH2 TaxID=3412483 RepID=UPI003C7BD854
MSLLANPKRRSLQVIQRIKEYHVATQPDTLAAERLAVMTDEQISQFELASDALAAVIAHYTNLITEAGSQEEADRLGAERMRYIIQQRDLDPGSGESIRAAFEAAEDLLGPPPE